VLALSETACVICIIRGGGEQWRSLHAKYICDIVRKRCPHVVPDVNWLFEAVQMFLSVENVGTCRSGQNMK
jgi:hypothetical protein